MRQPSTLIDGRKAYSNSSFSPVVDLRHNGQQGFVPDYRTYLSNSAYGQRNWIPFLLEYPRGFDFLDDKEVYIGTLKSLVETQAKQIDGINGTVTVQFFDNPVGSSGEIQQDYSRTERARTTPTFTWVERQGRPVQLFLNAWINNLLGHPDTQVPMINSYSRNKDKYFDFLPDFTSMSVLFVEPDPFQRRVVDAVLCINMMPQTSGDNTGKRELTAGFQGRDIQVEFTCMAMRSTGVLQFGQTLLTAMNYSGFNPDARRSAIEGIHANIKAVAMDVGYGGTNEYYNEGTGYSEEIDSIGKTNNYEKSGLKSKVQHNPYWTLSEGSDKNNNTGA